jgi:dihydrofolate reductase
MRRLVMWNMITLDGYFEGAKKWDLDFHNRGWGEELEQLSTEQLSTADMLLFGRRTFEGMAQFWPNETGEIADAMNAIPKVVFSRTLGEAAWSNSRVVADAEPEVRRLKAEDGKDMFIFGSAELCASLEPLIDEYRIGLNPILLGQGTPLFKAKPRSQNLKLLEARSLKTGCVLLRYAPEP